MAVGFLLTMVGTMLIATPTKDVHTFPLIGNGSMEISVSGRHTKGLLIAPLHGIQIEHMHIAAKLIDLIDKAAEYIHTVVNHTCRVSVPSARQNTTRRWSTPGGCLRIKTVKYIAQMFIIASAPDIDALLIRDDSMSIALKRDQRIFIRNSFLVTL
ncbi:CG12659 [Drosophila busckii]|uniref:CG12659 n=1 Tax=Drosophila busckii TaxID=30019 RepID=A0A0M4F7Z8_DROBS|nr:CG12659 [Drosophila busckii]